MLAEKSFLNYLRDERNYSDRTIVNYGLDLSQFHEFAQGEVSSFDWLLVDSQIVRSWMVVLLDKGYTATSVNRKLSSLRSFYKYLLKKGILNVDPLRKVVAPKKKKTLPSFLVTGEMDKLLDEVDFGEGFKASRDHLIIEMFYMTGIRLSELIGLSDADVDLTHCVLKVTGKRNKQRLIPFGDELKKMISIYCGLRDQEVSEKATAFFVRPDGRPLYSSLVYNIVKRNLSKVATLKKKSPHVLRHTFATSMLNNEAELNAVKELLGHTTLSATEIYTHTTFEELKKVYKQAHPRS